MFSFHLRVVQTIIPESSIQPSIKCLWACPQPAKGRKTTAFPGQSNLFFSSFWLLSVLKVYHGHCTLYIMHDSTSSLLVMTSFWRVKFTQLDGFARDRSGNIRCETLRFACRATFECCCFTCSRGEARQWVPTRAMNILSFTTHKLLFMEVGVAERMRTPPAHFTRGVQTLYLLLAVNYFLTYNPLYFTRA